MAPKQWCIATAVCLAAATQMAQATVLWQDDFNSYTDKSQVFAIYNGPGATGSAGPIENFYDLGVSDPDGGNATQAMHFLSSSTNGTPNLDKVVNPGAITPSDATALVYSFDFFWNGVGNLRTTGGLRVQTPAGSNSGIIEMGYYNNVYSPITQSASSGFAVRTVLVPGSGSLPEGPSPYSGWRQMTNLDGTAGVATVAIKDTWSTFTAVLRGHSIIYTIDVNRDGSIDSYYMATTPDLDLTHTAFTDLRLGTPSQLSSAAAGSYFDNVLLKTMVLGDINGNDRIDADDYVALDRSIALGDQTGYSNGDFNFDGKIDVNDYAIIDSAYAALNGGMSPAMLADREARFGGAYVSSLLASVPEPAALSPILAGLGLLSTSLRRRRQA